MRGLEQSSALHLYGQSVAVKLSEHARGCRTTQSHQLSPAAIGATNPRGHASAGSSSGTFFTLSSGLQQICSKLRTAAHAG
jgi:hypothetical protein